MYGFLRLSRLLVRGVPLRARLRLLVGGELGSMLGANVAEPRAARGVLATLHPATHVEPAASAAGAGDPRSRLVRLRALGQDALLLLHGYALCVVPAEPAVSRTGAWVLAAGRGTQAEAGGAEPAATSRGGSREHLFGAQGDRGGELLDQSVQQAVDGFGHSSFQEGAEILAAMAHSLTDSTMNC